MADYIKIKCINCDREHEIPTSKSLPWIVVNCTCGAKMGVWAGPEDTAEEVWEQLRSEKSKDG
jgi:hypothetical protein